MTTSQNLRVLSEPECLARLARTPIGRVAWNTVDGPHVLPVTYRVHARSIIVRTSADGVLAELAHSRRVAFEIDEYDPVDHVGWSVLVTGRSRAGSHPHELARLWTEADPEPWAGGTRNLFLVISIDRMSGRLVGP